MDEKLIDELVDKVIEGAAEEISVNRGTRLTHTSPVTHSQNTHRGQAKLFC